MSRQAANLTQSEAGEVTQTSRPTISRMERGLPASTATVVELLANTGYEILIVTRTSHFTVTDPEEDQ